MRLSRSRLGTQPTLSLILLLKYLLVRQVIAQDTTTSTNGAATTSTSDATTTGTGNTAGNTAGTATSSDDGTTSQTTGTLPALTTNSNSNTNTATLPALTTSTSTTNSLPNLTSSTNSLPSLSTATSLTYAIPVASVPPTSNAPYMQKSNLPDGTVFIAVGAALGVIALAVLAWRALVAWSINRSVRRAAMMQTQSDTKALLHRRRSRRDSRRHHSHQHRHRGSSMSMEKLSSKHRHGNLPQKGPNVPSGLFYSPTASAGMHTSVNRGSGYLPAGFYAAGSAVPGGGQMGSHASPSTVTLSTPGPQFQGYGRNLGPTPPGSPSLPPIGGQDTTYNRGASSSTLNLAHPQGRAPSAYLEDLFENHPPTSQGDHGLR